MTTKHTPGPWKLSGANTVHGADCIVAFVGTADEEVRRLSGERQSADAHLIAAAPDLLEMLEEMAAQHYCGCRHPACKRCKDDDACAAVIAKAKGEA